MNIQKNLINKSQILNKIKGLKKTLRKYKLSMRHQSKEQNQVNNYMLSKLRKYDQFYLYTSQNILFIISKLWKAVQISLPWHQNTNKTRFRQSTYNNSCWMNTPVIYHQSIHPQTHYLKILIIKTTTRVYSQWPKL